MSEPLTQLESRVYHYMIDFLAENTYQPSIREIARKFRIKSTKTVSDLLHSLENKGYIERDESRSRGVRSSDSPPPAHAAGSVLRAHSRGRTGAAARASHRVHHDRSPLPAERRRVLR